MKTIKTTLAILFISLITISCDNNDNNPVGAPVPAPSGVGVADITLTVGGQQFTIDGPCGWASAGGVKYIGANQSDNNLKVFSTYFNIQELPAQTTTYVLVEDDTDTDPSHITMNLTEIIPGTPPTLIEWSSINTSGTLTLVVEGNKVTVDLTGIVLKAGTGASGYTNGNVGAFANNGTLSGTLTFYK